MPDVVPGLRVRRALPTHARHLTGGASQMFSMGQKPFEKMIMKLFAVSLVLTVLAAPTSAQVLDRAPPQSAQLCVNCHNQTLEQQATPDAQLIPLLGAQQPKYLENAILAYARRQRDHFFMRGVAAGLNAEERAEVVHYFASAPPAPARPGAQVLMPISAAQCVSCHGDSTTPPATEDIPRLAGQHQPYLKGAFLGYAQGTRRHPVMQAIATDEKGALTLQPDELDAIARWFSGLSKGVSSR